MQPTPNPLPMPPLECGGQESFESLVRRFESLWLRGERPAINDFLATPGKQRALLVELVHAELELRLKAGEAARVEDYLARFPDLAQRPEVQWELIAAEYRQRVRCEPNLSMAEYSTRFPAWETQLRRLETEFRQQTDVAAEPSPPRAASVNLRSLADLLNALRESPVLGVGRLEELAREVTSRPAEPQALLVDLVHRGWLTSFQAEQLLQGQGHSLVVGSYVLLERLGQGGMGTVYKAQHRPMDRIVALKIIRSEQRTQDDAPQRFLREIQALAQLSHPNIVTAYHAGSEDDMSFLVMEYVEGTDLYRLVEKAGPLEVAQACEFIRQAALGLQHAYECGLVHRDIKPSNLLVTRDRGVIKLLDLGLVRREGNGPSALAAEELTRDGALLGTPDYMAPEQAVNPRQADIRADIYSLGCTLYYLLAARPPFPTGALTQKLLWHQQAEPAAIETLRPDIPSGLGAVLRKSMAKQPEARYQTPGAVAVALGPFAIPGSSPRVGELPSGVPLLSGETSVASAQSTPQTGPMAATGQLLEHTGKLLALLLNANAVPPGPPSAASRDAGPHGDAVSPTHTFAPAGSDGVGVGASHQPATAESEEKPEPHTAAKRKRKKQTIENRQVAKLLVQLGKMLVQVGKMLAVVLILVGVPAYLYLLWLGAGPEEPGGFQARIRSYLDREQFAQALDEIQKADVDEGSKAAARRNVRDGALVWASLQLKAKQEPRKVREMLERLARDYPDNAELQARRRQALNLDLQIEVNRFVARQNYQAALLALDNAKREQLADKLWVAENRARILTQWRAKTQSPQAGNPIEIPGRINGAVAQFKGLSKEEFHKVRGQLLELKKQADQPSQQRIAALLTILQSAQEAAGAADPLMSKELKSFETAFATFAKSSAIIDEDRAVVTGIYDRLLERRIKSSMLHFPDQGKWAQGLADCRKVKTPTLWVRAWQLECTAAELARSGNGLSKEQKAELQKGLQAIQKLSTEGNVAAAYVHYLSGMVDALMPDRARAAADLMVAYAGKEVSPLLAVKYRKSHTAAALLEAAASLRQERNLDAPFGTRQNADTAYTWLQRARALDPDRKNLQLPLNLALAGWSKSSPDKKLVATEVARLADPKNLDDLALPDAYLVLVLHANTRTDTRKGRTEAVASYEQAVAKAHALMRESPANVAVTEHVFRSVVVPVGAEAGKQLLSNNPDQALKLKLGRLCARIGQMIRSDPFPWSKVTEMGGNPLKTVARLYDQAYRIAGKTDYLVMRAFSQADAAPPDINQLEADAQEAIRKEKEYWGGHSLKGAALFLRSRRTSDYEERARLLRAADLHFTEAAHLASQEKNKEELSTFHRYRSSVCLELASFLFGPTEEKAKLIRNAETYARKATELNPRSFDAWDALAYAREDAAWALKDTGKYEQARAAYNQAILVSFRTDRVRPWLGRGRALYRWATVPEGLEKMTEAERARKMKDAESDLAEVFKRAQDSLEVAEAYYWQASIDLFHRSKVRSPRKKEEFLGRAEKGFAKSLALARKTHSADWEEAVLVAWSNLALQEGISRATSEPARAKHYYAVAEKLAGELGKYNVPEAARIQGTVVFRQTRNQQKAYAIFTKGLEKYRTQDRGSVVNLYCARASLRLRMEPADLNAVIKDARAAVGMSKEAELDRKIQAFARGTLGIGLYVSSITLAGDERRARRAETLSLFRDAIRNAPKHQDSYMWRWFLVEILSDKAKLSNKEWKEASENIAIAAATISSADADPAVMNYLPRIKQLNEWFNSKKR